ncbi:MAG: hypothetical protein LBM77_01210 [Spirochaetaceae bacterium]|jgi:hypothetical protein|nr:hypothetical protein [Spirochaetaceae bacterium]
MIILRKSLFYISITILLTFSGIELFAQDAPAPETPPAANAQPVSIALFPLISTGTPTESMPGVITQMMQSTIQRSESGPYTLTDIRNPPEDPGIPPTANEAMGAQYAITSQLFYSTSEQQTHAQLWLYNMGSDEMIATDEMVYANEQEAREYGAFFVEYILSLITRPEESPGETAEQQAAEEEKPEEEKPEEEKPEDGKTDIKDSPWRISFHYAPVIPLMGMLSKPAFQDSLLYPYGGNVAIGYSWNIVGIELVFGYDYLFKSAGRSGNNLINGHTAEASLNILIGQPKNNIFNWDIYLGAGGLGIFNFSVEEASPINVINLLANAGLDGRLRLNEFLYLDLRAGFNMAFNMKTWAITIGYINTEVGFSFVW